MSSLIGQGQGTRGKPPTGGVRSGGFQLLSRDAPSRQSPEQMRVCGRVATARPGCSNSTTQLTGPAPSRRRVSREAIEHRGW